MEQRKNNLSKKKSKKVFIIGFLILIILVSGIYVIFLNYNKTNIQEIEKVFKNPSILWNALDGSNGYVEMLVKTSDNILSKEPREKWTEEMYAEELAGNSKRGYIIDVKPKGFEWGTLETDPKRFAIIKIPANEFNKSWMESEYDKEGNIIKLRKYYLPLENFLNNTEINLLKNIPYGSHVNWNIQKNLTDVQNKIEIVNITKIINNPIILHGSAGEFTVCLSGCNYTSLANFENAEDGDIRVGGIARATVIQNFTENNVLTILGWTTNASSYIIINASGTARANGTWDMVNHYTLNVSSADGLSTVEEYITVEGIQVQVVGADANEDIVVVTSLVAGNRIIFSNMVLKGSGGSGGAQDGFQITDADANTSLYNNIIFNLPTTIGSYGINGGGTSSGVYSNTVDGGFGGIRFATSNATLKNNLVVNSSDSAYYTGTLTVIDHCMGDDGSSSVVGGVGNVNGTVDFVGLEDYHIKSSSSVVIDAGENLTASPNLKFNTDIDNQVRSGVWDIGADEIISEAPPEDTCTCPGAGNNWVVDMEDMCKLSIACNLDTGNLSWIGASGWFNCTAQLNLTNRNAPPSNTIFYYSDGCEVNR